MKHVISAVGTCCGVLLLILFGVWWAVHHPVAIRDYLSDNEGELRRVAEVLCEMKAQDPAHVILIEESNINSLAGLPDDVIETIRRLFRKTTCDTIFVSSGRGEGYEYCEFSQFKKETQEGIIFLTAGYAQSIQDEAFFGQLVKNCIRISPQWAFFEVYTYYGEKKMGYCDY